MTDGLFHLFLRTEKQHFKTLFKKEHSFPLHLEEICRVQTPNRKLSSKTKQKSINQPAGCHHDNSSSSVCLSCRLAHYSASLLFVHLKTAVNKLGVNTKGQGLMHERDSRLLLHQGATKTFTVCTNLSSSSK